MGEFKIYLTMIDIW